jgi:tetraprenyl-beta-curcumene synthase
MSKERHDRGTMTLGAARTLVSMVGRELVWGLPAVSRELQGWRTRAEAIPDLALRADALHSLMHKRDHAEGAALFSVLARGRNQTLIRLLVAYQTLWDYLDCVSERQVDVADGRQLHLALIDALNPETPLSDYYASHPWKDDGGYLLALVEACRTSCAQLPSYWRVRRDAIAWAGHCGVVQSLNHVRDPECRDAALRAWAASQSTGIYGLAWFELAGAASAVMPYPLLILAAEPACDEHDIATTSAAYFPWASLSVSMLDSYTDRHTDTLTGDHSYMSHYDDGDAALRRLSAIIKQTVREARSLRNGHQHTVIIACMVAMHLSQRSARAPDAQASTRALARAGGPLTQLLVPLVRLWTVARHRRSPAQPRVDAKRTNRELPRGPHAPRPAQTFVLWAAPFSLLSQCRKRYGSRFTLRPTSHPPLVFLCEREDIKTIIAAAADVLHPGEGAATVEPVVGRESFMLLDEEEHLAGRKTIAPAFHRTAVETHADLVAEIAAREVASWPQGIPFAVHPRLRALTLEVALRTTLGPLGRGADKRLEDLRDGLLQMLAVTGSVVFPEPLLRHGPGRVIWRRFLREREDVDELIYEMIEDRRRCKEGEINVLDRLLVGRNADGSPRSRQQIRDDLMSTILAGHETTAAELAWAFQLLAHNPLVLVRLLDAIDCDGGGEYLTATIQEVLRHRPVFLFTIPREVKQPIEIGGWVYRPPAQLLGCIYLLHHDPRHYPDPDSFCPERFLETAPTAQTWLPWGGGRRRCPGRHLAVLEMETVLRTVLQTMTVRPASKTIERPRWRSVIVTPHAGSRVVLQQRRRSTRTETSDRSVLSGSSRDSAATSTW